MRAQFVLSEVGIGLRRNLVMTIATVITVAVSLFQLGGGLLVRSQVSAMKDFWYDKVEVSVFLCGAESTAPSCSAGAVTDAQRTEIEKDLRAMPQVQTVYYESQQEAYKRFKEQFKNTAIVENVSADVLPESYRVKLKNPEDFEIISSAFQGRPGVDEVQDQRQLLKKLFSALSGVQWGSLWLAVFMLVAVVLLVANTMQVMAFSRRRETGIMRLVGASNLYIQLPFVLEAAFAAFVGGLLASAGLVVAKAVVIDSWLAKNFAFLSYIGWPTVWRLVALILVFGMVLSSIVSLITLRRYLRV